MEFKISGKRIYWEGGFRAGTLVKRNGEVQFLENQYEGDYVEGWICPGLVNVHSHLELSHLGAISSEVKGKGMAFFIEWVQRNRTCFQDQLEAAAEKVLTDFQKEGTFFIGDICNSLVTLPIKERFPSLYFQNFYEVFGLNPVVSEEQWGIAQQNARKLNAFLTLHAPYSVSFALRERVIEANPYFQSLHLAESREEWEYFRRSDSEMRRVFLRMGIPSSFLKERLPYSEAVLSEKVQHYLLVHNVFLEVERILPSVLERCYFGLCPTSNLFLHQRTVSMEWIMRWAEKVCLGTDSAASNAVLSILHEMNFLASLGLAAEKIVAFATHNGYAALKIPRSYLQSYRKVVQILERSGSFESKVLC